MKSTNGVSVLVDTLISLYTLEPILRGLSSRDVPLYVFSPKNVRDYIQTSMPGLTDSLRPLEPLSAKHRRALYLHRFARQMLTSPDYSFQYRLLSDPSQFPGDFRYWLTAQLSRVFPKLPHHLVNKWLSRIVGPVVGNPFPTTRVVTVSRSSMPHLLCSSELSVYTVLESWDHPVKWPVGHRSTAVYVWNEDLAQDWRMYQGDKSVYSNYPLKMRYWLDSALAHRHEIVEKTAVYSAGTSSLSYVNELFKYELAVIDAVCQATKDAGWRLMIKPKPNGVVGDFDRFENKYEHVNVGEYRGVASSVDYFLDDRYNEQRALEMSGTALLINALTTFSLDAALMGVPCLQLDLRSCPEYKGVSEGQTNHHIAEYMLGASENYLKVESGQLSRRLAEYLRDPDGRAELNRDRLVKWITPEYNLRKAANVIVDDVLST